MRWHHAIIYPDINNSWNWAQEKTFGRSGLERLEKILKRGGIDFVHLFPEPPFRAKTWQPPREEEPILLVRGGLLWRLELLKWFENHIKTQDFSILTMDGLPVIASCPYRVWKDIFSASLTFPEIKDFPYAVEVPWSLRPGGITEEEIVRLSDKPSDRPHVVWVRKQIMPLLRFFAHKDIHPNQVTWLGFIIHILGCCILLLKSYLAGIVGSLMLILSWVFDCADGTLARITMQESQEGKKLDTTLGNISNLAVFTALLWREYSRSPIIFIALLLIILTGIGLSYYIHEKMPKKDHSYETKIASILTKINHRDYAFVILAFALLGGLKIFIWMSAIGIHIYWMLELWTIARDGTKSFYFNN